MSEVVETFADTIEGRHSTPMGDGRLRCDVCPRQCTLSEGQRGLCFVRARQGDRIVLTTYGRSSGFCVDPIEKKPLSHFLPGSPVLSFGTAGCNLTCRYCQNWDISTSRKLDRLLDQAPPAQIAKAAAELGCRSVAFTYNDPVIFLEYAVDTAWACREAGLKSVAVTAGYLNPAARRDFFEPIDAANVDLKAFTERFYRKLCSAELKPVLETLEYLVHETDVWVEITTLLIPGENDGESELRELSRWIVQQLGPNVPLHFSAFHPDHKMKGTPRTPVATLRRARAIAREAGVHYVFTGNVHDEQGQSTFCPSCDAVVIGRDWYRLTEWNLVLADENSDGGLRSAAGACGTCGGAIAGHFEPTAGDWGPRRLPIRIGS